MSLTRHTPSFVRLAVLGLVFLLIFLITWLNGSTPAQEHAQSDDHTAEQLSVAYAHACLRLAEAELAEAHEQNRRAKNSVTEYDLERLRLHKQAAQQNVSYAEQGSDTSQSILGHVELQSHLADLDLKLAQELHENHVDSFSDQHLERLRAYSEVFRLRLELVHNPVSTLKLIDHLHWETHRLSEEILLLNRRIERLEETARQ